MGMMEIDLGPMKHSNIYIRELLVRCVFKQIITPEGAQHVREELV